MKTNAIVRIILWSAVIVILAGILVTALAGGALYSVRRSESIVYRDAPDDADSVTVTLLQDTNIYSTPHQESDVLRKAAAGENLSILRQETINQVSWGLTSEGWIQMEFAAIASAAFPSDAFQFPAEDFSKLVIQWAAGDIRVVPKAGIDVIEVSESSSGSKFSLHCKTSGRKLTIQYSKDSIFDFGIHFGTVESKDLYVFVPENWICDELRFEVAAADVDVQNMTIHALDFDGASGTCNFADCIVGDLDIDTASGDVTFTGELEVLDFDAATASFRGTLSNCPREIDMDSMSGDLDLTLPEDCGFTLNMDGLSSNFRCEFEYAQRGDGIYVSGDGSCRIDVDGVSSDVYIRRCTASPATSPEVSTAPTSGAPLSPIHHEHTDACTTDPGSCPDSATHHPEH